MEKTRRVVVTGMGAISPLGLDVPSLWQGIVESRSGIGPITLFDAKGHDTKIAGEATGFDPKNYMDSKEVRRTDRFVHLALATTQETLQSADFTITTENRDRVGVFVGSGIGGIDFWCKQHEVLLTRGPGRVSPFTIPAMIINIAAGHVSMMTGARGPNVSHTSACASGAHAIGEAAEAIKHGRADVMLAGGTEAPVTAFGVAGFNSARAISTRNDTPESASRPFDETRDGFVLSEGAAILLLEELEHARRRGARILAEFVSYGASADSYHITQPPENGAGAALAMKNAFAAAGLSASNVSYINAHGTSTPAGDIAETAAIKSIFGDVSTCPPVSSSKSQFGHLLGAAGPLEAVVCIMAIQHNMLPPTINLNQPDPLCDLDFVPHTARPAQIDVVVSNSFGFGGHNVSLVFRRYTETS